MHIFKSIFIRKLWFHSWALNTQALSTMPRNPQTKKIVYTFVCCLWQIRDKPKTKNKISKYGINKKKWYETMKIQTMIPFDSG